MKRKLLFYLFSNFSIFISYAQDLNFQWAKNMGSAGYNSGHSVKVDLTGNVYTIGDFIDTVDFDPGPGVYNLIATSPSVFLSKLDPAGNFIWAKQIGGFHGNSIVIDGAGNIYTMGNFNGTADFDPGPGVYNLSTSAGVFISKLDASGNFVWAKGIGTGYYPYYNNTSIAIDLVGNVYAIGGFLGTVDFDPGPAVYNLTSAAAYEDIFISKLDNSGNFMWAKRIGGAGQDIGLSVAVDIYGNIYTTGSFSLTTDFDPGAGVFNLTAIYEDIFICKLDASGAFVWARRIGGSDRDVGRSIAVDDLGNVYTTGSYFGIVDFNPGAGVYNLLGLLNVFVLKLDTDGSFVWAWNASGASDSGGYSIAIDAKSNVYTTGIFSGTADFDPTAGNNNLTAVNDDVFVTKLDSSGTLVWAKQLGHLGINFGKGIAVDAESNVYVTGWFDSVADYDPGAGIYNLIPHDGREIFIVKLGTPISDVTEETSFFDAPNIFTPNHDGINDMFTIPNLQQGSEVKIYDRWGIEVLSSNIELISNSGWDGRTTAGLECTIGVYYYIVNIPNDKPLKGFVQLLR